MSWINNSNNEIENFIHENEKFLNDKIMENKPEQDNENSENSPPKRLTTEEINFIFE